MQEALGAGGLSSGGVVLVSPLVLQKFGFGALTFIYFHAFYLHAILLASSVGNKMP